MAVMCLAGCKLETDDTPVAAARAMLQSAQRGKCLRAYGLFSESRRASIQAEFARKRPRGVKDASELYCLPGANNPYPGMVPSSAALLSGNDSHSATVKVDGQDDSGSPLTLLLTMVNEDGHWRVDSTSHAL
jgi:hypothetical protein